MRAGCATPLGLNVTTISSVCVLLPTLVFVHVMRKSDTSTAPPVLATDGYRLVFPPALMGLMLMSTESCRVTGTPW